MLKPSRFIDVLRLRSNTFGTRTVMARAYKKIGVACRRCRAQPETPGHILGLCQYTKGQRIKRYDEVKSIFAAKLRKNNEVFVESTLKVGDNLWKPDLVVRNDKRLLVVDITVHYENKDYLQRAEKEKAGKYSSCLQHPKNKFNIGDEEVSPTVLGSRGAITSNTERILKRIGISDKEIKTIVMNV